MGDSSVLLVEQYRYATGTWQWELPQGSVEDGEEVAAAALRELREETGWHARVEAVLPQGIPEASDWATHSYRVVITSGIRPEVPETDLGEASLEARAMPIHQLRAMIADGRVTDPPTICAFYLWELRRQGADADG